MLGEVIPSSPRGMGDSTWADDPVGGQGSGLTKSLLRQRKETTHTH